MKQSTWHNCYDDGWKGLIVPEAFAHPAKFSLGLVTRIVRHGLDMGYWKPGDTIGDPFGGVALGGIVCGYNGLNWVGVELEPRFHELGNKNLAMHGPRWLAMEQANRVTLLQGDSRRFAEIVGGVEGFITSPPYAESVQGAGESVDATRERMLRKGIDPRSVAKVSEFGNDACSHYGDTPGNIGNLKSGNLDAVISSPPYADSVHDGNGIDASKLTGNPAGKNSQAHAEGYGTTPGQIGALSAGSLEGVVTSPPYEGTHVAAEDNPYMSTGGKSLGEAMTAHLVGGRNYGGHEQQIGNLRGGWNQCVNCGRLLSHTGRKSDFKNSSPDGLSARSAPASVQPFGAALCAESESCPPVGASISGGQIGPTPGPQQSSETAENAATAEQQTTCRYTTKGTRKKRAANGITRSATSKHSAEPATQSGTHSPESTDFSSANSAEPKSGAVAARSLSASATNAESDTSKKHSEPTERGNAAALLCADCAASQSQSGSADTSTALTNAAEQPSQAASKRTGDPNAETYWSAMRQVYAQMKVAMKPGAVCAIVVKDYISKGKRVPLCDQTCTLLESLGFTVFERSHAMLVKTTEHRSLFDGGETLTKTTERKSFFRRLAEKKGSPKIDWEEVIWATS